MQPSFQLENERLVKCVEVYKKSLEAKNEDIENKNGIINKLLGKSLSSNANSSFAQLQPQEYLPETKNLHRPSQNHVHKNVEDDIDIDGLLQANLDFDILDLSMSGSILNNDLPLALASTELDVYGEFNDQVIKCNFYFTSSSNLYIEGTSGQEVPGG